MEAETDTYDAPVPPAEGENEDYSDPFTLSKQEQGLDDLFWGHDEPTKESLISFVRTGAAPKDGVRHLHNFCLSVLYQEEGEYHANNDQKNISLSPTPSQNTTTTITSTATTPLEETHTPKLDDEAAEAAHDLFNHLEGDVGVRTFFLATLASGKVSPAKVEKLFDISTLAGTEDFSTIMQHSQGYRWVQDQASGHQVLMREEWNPATGQHVLVPQHLASSTVSSQGIASQQPQSHIQTQYNQAQNNHYVNKSPGLQSPAPQFHHAMNPDFGHHGPSHQGYGLPAKSTGTTMGMPMPMGPLPHGGSPYTQPRPSSGHIHHNGNQSPAPSVPARQNLAGMDPQNHEQPGVSAPLARASSNQSERSVHSPDNNVHTFNNIGQKQVSNPNPTPRNGNSSSQADVISCSIINDDGRPCNKLCTGEHRYRSITEHIRRAHNKYYIPNLQATEESYKRMLDSQGVTCRIVMPDGKTPCLNHCTGSKMWKEIIDHVKEKHQDHWIPGLPANKDSYNKMAEREVYVECPLHTSGGSPCKKRCFGAKRWRSIQEHIRRNHRPYWVKGLKATEESFKKMTTRQPDPPELVTQSTTHSDGQDGQAPSNDVQSGSHGSMPLPALNSPVVKSEDQPSRALDSPHERKPSNWASPGQNGDETVSPKATLTMSEIDQHHSGEGMSAYPTQYGFPQNQQWAYHLEPQQIPGLAALREDKCLTDPLFDSARILGTGEAMETAGDIFSTGSLQEQTLVRHIAQHGYTPMLPASGLNSQSSESIPRNRKRLHDGTNGTESGAQEHPAKKQAVQQGSEASAAGRSTPFAHDPNLNGFSNMLQHSPLPGLVSTPPPDVNGSPSSQPDPSLSAVNTTPSQVNGYHTLQQDPALDVVINIPLHASNGLPMSQSGSPPAAVFRTPSKPYASQSTQKKITSRFFSSPTQTKQNQTKGTTRPSAGPSPGPTTPKRPPPNTISSLPFPVLTVDNFGLIQEDVAHDPFRLLIAVQFLVKTAGRSAIPVFQDVMRKWPTPAALAAADRFELLKMIHHLGLQEQRCTIIQRYAKVFVENPPTRAVRYGVKDYPRVGDAKNVKACEVFGPEDEEHGLEPIFKPMARGHGTAWEIGHITAGPYAIDSWRIFCRDVLLSRAEDYRGKGRGPTFQPEWMRVQPTDKELRSYLRWMWMKEGWLWDAETGEKSVLSEEMRIAVNKGRVEYDEGGNLKIVADGVIDGGAEGVLNS